MRAVVQRVTQASVAIDGNMVGSIGRGFLILLGVGEGDTTDEAERLWQKIWKLRIFPDGTHHTGASLADIGGEVLVVSQFTLYADCRKGNRPSFVRAARPETAEPLYEYLNNTLRNTYALHVAPGRFGADMKVDFINDGPVTILLDTDDL